MDTKTFNDLAYTLSQQAIAGCADDLLDASAVLLAASVFCARQQYGDDARLVLAQLLDRWAPEPSGHA